MPLRVSEEDFAAFLARLPFGFAGPPQHRNALEVAGGDGQGEGAALAPLAVGGQFAAKQPSDAAARWPVPTPCPRISEKWTPRPD